MQSVMLVGSGAREHALGRALRRTLAREQLAVFASTRHPGLADLAGQFASGRTTDPEAVVAFAREAEADTAVIGPEAPLEAGVADALRKAGLAVFGPSRALARIETSKGFARDLMTARNIPGCPAFQRFARPDGIEAFLEELDGEYVIKADGLMGGKGVKVSGEHLHSTDEALAWCRELLENGSGLVVEEKCVGAEFSLFTLTDGEAVLHSPVVQDHKRAFEGDLGPNTGGMGSYSMPDHGLPFLTPADLAAARDTNEKVLGALASETGEPYRGVLYGGFMATADGVRVIEFNARFGDPECLNLMCLVEGDLAAAFHALARGSFDPGSLRFRPEASVCKYAVPEGYPDNPARLFPVDTSAVEDPERCFLGSVDLVDSGLLAAGSRTVACVGTGTDLATAERRAEAEISRVTGRLFHRSDIGTDKLVQERIALMNSLRTQL